jgi:hypothetical protein
MAGEESSEGNRWLHVLAFEERAQQERTERAIVAIDTGDAGALAQAIGCALEEAQEALVRMRAPTREERESWLYRWAMLARLPEIP